MTELAFYETNGGAEEIKIDTTPKNIYILKNVAYTLLWMTLAYIMMAIFAYQAFVSYVFTSMTKQQMILVLAFMGIAYVSLAVVYGIKATYHYKKKHMNAHYHVRDFKKKLAELERMYEEENGNE